MIIKSFRVPTSESLGRLREHVFRGGENAEVRILRGTEADLADFRDLALKRGATYAIRHFIIASDEALSACGLLGVFDDLANEFAVDPHICVAVLHRKPRRKGKGETHLHVFVPEIDASTGGVMSSAHDWVRHEKIARIAEHRHGHQFVEGAHLPAVLATLRTEGRSAIHDALIAAFPKHSRPVQAFSTVNAKRVAREAGLDLASLKIELQDLWKSEASIEVIASRLAEHGIEIHCGDKPETLVLSTSGVHVAALHRILGLRKGTAFKEFTHVAVSAAAPRSSDKLSRAGPTSSKPSSLHPSGDACDPSSHREQHLSGESERRWRGRSNSVDVGCSIIGSERIGGAENECRSHSPTTRHGNLARTRRRTVEARIRARITDEQRARAGEQKRLAERLAISAPASVRGWLDQRLRELDDEEALIRAPSSIPTADVDRSKSAQGSMQKVILAHQREIATITSSISEMEKVGRAGGFWRRVDRKPVAELEKLHIKLRASRNRLAECEQMSREVIAAAREEQRRLLARSELAERARIGRLADLTLRRQALHFLIRELTTDPSKAFGGSQFIQAGFDRITAGIKEGRIERLSADYKNRTDMWGIGQLKFPL